jgi:hypothetical protein
MPVDYYRRSIMTQATCGICGQAPSEHSQDQLHKCFSDAGFEVEHTIGDALFIGREFRIIRKYSPPDGKGIAKVWFKADPETMIETGDLSNIVFKEALPKLEKYEPPQKKDDGGKSSDEENYSLEEPVDPEDMVFDDETLERMDEDEPSEG